MYKSLSVVWGQTQPCDEEGSFLEVEQEEPLEYGSGSGDDSRLGAEEGEGD